NKETMLLNENCPFGQVAFLALRIILASGASVWEQTRQRAIGRVYGPAHTSAARLEAMFFPGRNESRTSRKNVRGILVPLICVALAVSAVQIGCGGGSTTTALPTQPASTPTITSFNTTTSATGTPGT